MIKSKVKTKEGTEDITAYAWNEVPLPVVTYQSVMRNHKQIKYGTDYMCLDTETSHIELDLGWIYQWAIKWGKLYIYGRTPSDLISFLDKVVEFYELDEKKRIIILVHNLAYDMQYLKHFIHRWDPSTDFFAIDNHAFLSVECVGIRFLCSYKLTNLSLDALAKNYSQKYIKAVGEIDYQIVRYQDQELSPDTDWYYMFSDVAAQYDGVAGYIKTQGYKYLCNCPITSTGFVRSECRKSSYDAKWHEEFYKTGLTLKQYNLARSAFMGGVCIANYQYAGKTIRRDDLAHDDFTSSYPARQIYDYFPRGAANWYGNIENMEEFENLLNNYCCIFILTATDIHIKKGVTAPCIPSSKCFICKDPLKLNGKLVYASEISIAICELDYKWIRKQYDIKGQMYITNLMYFKRGPFPDWLKSDVLKYFENKCTLKDVDELLYMKSKNMLNSIYGMTATAIIRDTYKMNPELIMQPKEYKDDEKEKEDQKTLTKYYNSYNNFMPYQFAVYTTAWARDALYTMIEKIGYDKFLYCDTDSAFYIKTPENVKAMATYRENCRNRAIENGGYYGDKYLGEPTPEPPIRAFRALHSKCYAMEELDKEAGDYRLKVVIAGIPKKSIKWINGKAVTKTNAEELGSIDNLNDGFTFKHCGGTRCVYIEQKITEAAINGHKTEYASSAIIENIEKEVSDTMWTTGADYSILDDILIESL